MNETILIADDEERMRNLLAAYLKKEGYNILQAENGEEVLHIFRNQKVELIILDIMMPVMDGWTACKELRKFTDVPIILLTAKGEDEDKILGYEIGTDHYVTKPFEIRILLAKVRSLINRFYNIKIPTDKKFYFEGLEIDELSHKVTVDGEEIYLSPKEYDLLLYFAVNNGLVLSREKLLDHVWGIDFYGDFRTVDSHVKRVREKLKEKAYLISTIRGVGYKFESKN